MSWDPDEAMALARTGCARCLGIGTVRNTGWSRKRHVCGCVLRRIFRQCLAYYRRCAILGETGNRVVFERRINGRRAYCTFHRPRQEFRVDFEAIGRRVLDARRRPVFELHFLCGLDWRVCTGLLHMDRGDFFHDVYRVEAAVGRALREMEPHGLYPTWGYFDGRQKQTLDKPTPGWEPWRRQVRRAA